MTSLPTFSTLGAGPLLLMLHDVGGGHLAFAPQVEAYANAGYRAVAWDMPGYGRSAPVEPYAFKGLAASCVALIEALRAPSGRGVILLGHGLGGMVAQEVAARRPELVRRLILSATVAWSGDPQALGLQAFIAQQLVLLQAGQAMSSIAELTLPQTIGAGALPEGVALATRCLAEVHPSTYRRALQAMATFDRRASLPALHVPTLLIAGAQDRQAAPAAVRAMADAIDGSRYVELAGIGHCPPLEAPDEFDALVLDFLRTAPPTLH